MLLVCKFEACDPGASGVDRLRNFEAGVRSSRRERSDRYDRRSQLLVEEACLEESQWVQILLVKQIVIIGMFGLQCRIATRVGVGIDACIECYGWNHIFGIWTRHPSAIH